MSSGTEPQEDVYDAVVIGSGTGGITAAALLARAGKRVLVVERQEGPGGYAHVFRRSSYVFDPAVHAVPDQLLFDELLEYLGVRDRCTFLPNDHFFTLVLPDFKLDLPLARDAFIDAYVRRFPEHEDEIRRYFDVCLRFHREAHDLPPRMAFRELDQLAERFPLTFKYLRATVGEVLKEYLTDARVETVCGALSWYTGLPASRMSFQTYAQMLGNHLTEGSFYCQGSFQTLIDAMVAALTQHGGELALGNEARRILLEDGRARGVQLASGREVQAPLVISNADGRHTYEDLVGFEHLSTNFVHRLCRMQPSLTGCILYVATNLDLTQLGATPEYYAYKSWDFDELYERVLPSGRTGVMWVNVPTLVDPSLAPEGEHLLIISAYLPYDIGEPWEQAKMRYSDEILRYVETTLFPGLRDHLTFLEVSTPVTLERYTRNQKGAIYAWANTPEQTGSRRLAHQSPIPGLYLSGHWTVTGSGFLRSTVSGVHVAQLVLRDAEQQEALADLHLTHLPPAF